MTPGRCSMVARSPVGVPVAGFLWSQASIAVAQPVSRGQDRMCEGPWVEVVAWNTRLRTKSVPCRTGSLPR